MRELNFAFRFYSGFGKKEITGIGRRFTNGRQIVPESCIHEILEAKVPYADLGFQFGYRWWVDPLLNWQFMRGHGGQLLFLIP